MYFSQANWSDALSGRFFQRISGRSGILGNFNVIFAWTSMRVITYWFHLYSVGFSMTNIKQSCLPINFKASSVNWICILVSPCSFNCFGTRWRSAICAFSSCKRGVDSTLTSAYACHIQPHISYDYEHLSIVLHTAIPPQLCLADSYHHLMNTTCRAHHLAI